MRSLMMFACCYYLDNEPTYQVSQAALHCNSFMLLQDMDIIHYIISLNIVMVRRFNAICLSFTYLQLFYWPMSQIAAYVLMLNTKLGIQSADNYYHDIICHHNLYFWRLLLFKVLCNFDMICINYHNYALLMHACGPRDNPDIPVQGHHR